MAGLEAVAGSSASGQAFLTPVGTVVVGLAAAETYAKAYQARVTSDQKVGPRAGVVEGIAWGSIGD